LVGEDYTAERKPGRQLYLKGIPFHVASDGTQDSKTGLFIVNSRRKNDRRTAP